MQITLNHQQVFPVGTTVKAYLRSNWQESERPVQGGAPKGAAAAEGVVGANGDYVFANLTENAKYYAVAEVAGAYRYVRFIAASTPIAARKVGTTAGTLAAGDDERFSGVATFGRSGSIFVTPGQGRFTLPFAATILGVISSLATPPTGAAVLVDVNKNGVTVFTTQASRPSIAIGENVSGTKVPDVTALAKGDYLTVDIDQIGSTIAGADLVVEIFYARV